MNEFNLFGENNIVEKAALRESAEASHKLFEAYCEAGFSVQEALYLIAYITTHPIQTGGTDGQNNK